MKSLLSKPRKEIDKLDKILLSTLAKRFLVSKQIGIIKRKHNVKIKDNLRWNEILVAGLLNAKKLNLSQEFVKKLYKLIHDYSINIQKKK